jgi:LDH2 family malate/lactate/ureidoglycolate dehydrogenase
MRSEEAYERLRALGFGEEQAAVLFEHFSDAERRGKLGHGFSRIEWLETLPDIEPRALPVKVRSAPGFDRWEGRGALGYLTLAAICAELEAAPPEPASIVVAADCFPTGMLGHWVRRLARAGLAAVLTATSPARLAHPAGGPPLVGTNPLAIGIPAAEGDPVVVDVSMGEVTYGEVLAGLAPAERLVPFGG